MRRMPDRITEPDAVELCADRRGHDLAQQDAARASIAKERGGHPAPGEQGRERRARGPGTDDEDGP
jgi:hypothetical protein